MLVVSMSVSVERQDDFGEVSVGSVIVSPGKEMAEGPESGFSAVNRIMTKERSPLNIFEKKGGDFVCSSQKLNRIFNI
ncbi:hypothetical protein NPIL_861 [Nephila pilipes]|uniref:Uncharacterized protein n=1 Tax=Nephila pilipes TaxID=299642 RepID=A0A8X6I4T9_NEPPI|nr:hypothetical protein NPIL_861 [Nephila pilipes]